QFFLLKTSSATISTRCLNLVSTISAMQTISIGFRARTGKAVAIALARYETEPSFLGRWEVSLVDPKYPATAQQHHEVMELPWPEARTAVQPIETRVENVAIEALSTLLGELKSSGCRIRGIGVVGSPDRDLERIGNRHMRAHAAEGILFRRVLEV